MTVLAACLFALILPLARIRARAIRLRIERGGCPGAGRVYGRVEGWREPRQPWG